MATAEPLGDFLWSAALARWSSTTNERRPHSGIGNRPAQSRLQRVWAGQLAKRRNEHHEAADGDSYHSGDRVEGYCRRFSQAPQKQSALCQLFPVNEDGRTLDGEGQAEDDPEAVFQVARVTIRACANAHASLARMVRSAWSATRSRPLDAERRKRPLVLKPPGLALDGGAS